MSNKTPYGVTNVKSAIGHYLLGRGVGAIFGFGAILLLVRYMSVQEYASYIALTGLVGIAAMLSSLGLERAITRFVPEGRICHSEVKLQSFVFKIVLTRLAATSLVALLLAAIWSWFVTFFDFVEFAHMPLALAIFLVGSSLFEILSTVLQALVRQKLLTQIMVLIWGARFVALVYLAQLQGGLVLQQVLWLMALPELAGAAALLVAVSKALRYGGALTESGVTPEALAWPQWREARSLAGHAYVFNMLASVPQGYFMRTLVAATLPLDIVAAYGFFSSLVDKLRNYLPIQLMYNLFEPVLVARYLETKDEHTLARHIALMYKSNLLIIVMALVFLAVSGQAVVGMASGGKFLEHTWILLLLVVQIALGSHVLAIQLVVNVLKLNQILSQAAAVALAGMLAFIGIVHLSGQPLLLLFAVLIYSLNVNAFALWRLAQYKAAYRPPRKEAFMLATLALPVVVIANMAIDGFHMAPHVLPVLLLGGAAGMGLALCSLILKFASAQDVGLLKSLIKPNRKV